MSVAEGSTSEPYTPGFGRFLWLWASQTMSLFGSMITTFALNVWLVRDLYPLPEQKPALALALSAVSIAGFAPLVIAMPIAGAYADRHDRRRILIVANVVLATLTAVLVTLAVTERLTLPAAAAILAGYAIATSFHNAAFDSSYGHFVSAADLPRASGMMMTSQALAQMLAPGLAAALVALPALLGLPSWLPHGLERGVPFAFAADGLTFVVAAIVATSLRFPVFAPRAAAGRTSLVADVRAGFRWILTRKPFGWLLGMGSLANFTFSALFVLLPLLARDRVGADAAARGMSFEAVFAMANMVGGLGGVLGGVLVSALGLPPMKRSAIMALSLVVLGVGEAIAGLSTTVWMLAVGMFVGEFLIAPLNTASFTLWQSVTPPHMLARALSTRRFLAQSAFPIGTALAGWLAIRLEPWLVVTGAGSILAVACLAQYLRPGFATLEDELRTEAARAD